MEKYGFVYIWFDRKHKRYYVGCHWGTENDRYICSSNWMRDAYKRRPEDFKRRILKTNILSRVELLEEEFKWLSLIKEEELGKRYYNIRNHYFKHWSSDDFKRNLTEEKIKKRLSQLPKRIMPEEERKKRSEVWIGENNPCKNPEILLKIIKGKTGLKRSPEQIESNRIKIKNWHDNHEISDETRKKLSIAGLGNKRCVGREPWNRNKPHSEDHKQKLKDAYKIRILREMKEYNFLGTIEEFKSQKMKKMRSNKYNKV